MNIQDFREFCLSLPGTEESFPFDESTLVFKVKGKIFALTDVDLFTSVNLKCEPEKRWNSAIVMRPFNRATT
jgi:predicted DNA-binding protein (MmcQ/YjbR family)